VPTLHGGWTLTTEHAASYGQPVLVSPDGTAYGPGDLLTTAQAAAITGVGMRTMQEYVERGRIAAIRPARDYLMTVADVLAFERPPQGRPPKS
jgi:excisionase family DNA binding protein